MTKLGEDEEVPAFDDVFREDEVSVVHCTSFDMYHCSKIKEKCRDEFFSSGLLILYMLICIQ